MAKKSKCSPNMTYVLCLVIVGLIIYLLYSNYKESFYSETVLELRKQEVEKKQEEKKKAEKELKEAKEKLEEAEKEKANESEGKTTESNWSAIS